MVLSKDLKQAIAFGLIVGCIIQIFSVLGFCAETEEISFDVVTNLGLSDTNYGSSGVFTAGNTPYKYIAIEPGYTYTFTSDSRLFYLFSNSEPAVNVNYYNYTRGNNSLVINGNEFQYIYFVNNGNNATITCTRTELTGLSGFIGFLLTSLTLSDLNTVVYYIVPILAISVLVGLGVYLLYRLFRKIKRARGGI